MTVFYRYMSTNGTLTNETLEATDPPEEVCITLKNSIDGTGFIGHQILTYESGYWKADAYKITKINADGTTGASIQISIYNVDTVCPTMALNAAGTRLFVLGVTSSTKFVQYYADLTEKASVTGCGYDPLIRSIMKVDAQDIMYWIRSDLLVRATVPSTLFFLTVSLASATCFALEHRASNRPNVWVGDATSVYSRVYSSGAYIAGVTSTVEARYTIDIIVNKENTYVYSLSSGKVVRREVSNPDTTITYDAYTTENIVDISTLTLDVSGNVYFCGTDLTTGLFNYYKLGSDLTGLSVYIAKVRSRINGQDWLGYNHNFVNGT